MLVSWNWLKEYVSLDITPAQLTDRLMMAGLNHESTETAGTDFAIDLEITSNRPDCLGHIGIAREAAVLWQQPLKLPAATPRTGATAVETLAKVSLQCPDQCTRYLARVIRGAKIGPSPAWLANRLQTIGIAVINNVVDITNYVLMECGQPLHAFDLARLNGREIVVRQAKQGEPFVAIDHKTYTLESGMCVIADANRPVALGGVMGGADTEVSSSTTELLIEAANFSPLSIRTTARKLSLHSPSSYRFERGVDPDGLDWASRRCCELILDLAGGELASGVIAVGREPEPRQPVVLRLSQLKRILGIEIPPAEVQRIVAALGCQNVSLSNNSISSVPPSWRRDLTREIDFVEEVARIHGYEAIPEDVSVPMAPSHRSDRERILGRVRQTLTGVGFDEAMTISVVHQELSDSLSPWTDAEAIVCNTPILRGADRLRRSLLPSLLEARHINESLSNPAIELFETARIYLPVAASLPNEVSALGIVSGGNYFKLKGTIEALLAAVCSSATLEVVPTSLSLLNPAKTSELRLNGNRLGFLGEVSQKGLKQFGLRTAATVAEIDLAILGKFARLIPQFSPLSAFPAISRDLNLVVDEAVRWSDLEQTVRGVVGSVLESVHYQETYRDYKKDGEGKKRQLFTLVLRSSDRTLTNEEADALRESVVAAAKQRHGAVLLG